MAASGQGTGLSRSRLFEIRVNPFGDYCKTSLIPGGCLYPVAHLIIFLGRIGPSGDIFILVKGSIFRFKSFVIINKSLT